MRPAFLLACLVLGSTLAAGCLDGDTGPNATASPGADGGSPPDAGNTEPADIEVVRLEAPEHVYDGDTVAFWVDLRNTGDRAVNETICLVANGLEVACGEFHLPPGETVKGLVGPDPYDQKTPFVHAPAAGTTTTYRVLDAEHHVTSGPMPRLGDWIEGDLVDMALLEWQRSADATWSYGLEVRHKEVLGDAFLHFPDYGSWPGRNVSDTKVGHVRYDGTLSGPGEWSRAAPSGDLGYVEVDLLTWFVVPGDGSTGRPPESGDFRWSLR